MELRLKNGLVNIYYCCILDNISYEIGSFFKREHHCELDTH